MNIIFDELYIKNDISLFLIYITVIVLIIIITSILVKKELRNKK